MGLSVEGLWREPFHPQLKRVEITLARLPQAFDGFTIAQLSDFHYDTVFTVWPLRNAVEIVSRLKPDLLVLTGDFVTVSPLVDYLNNAKESAEAADPCAQELSVLRPRYGTIASLGNHDVSADPDRVTRALLAHNFTVLRNQAVPLEVGGGRIWLAGLDSVLDGKPDLKKTLKGIPPKEAVVMLVHEPDFADRVAKSPVDLQLSGHSHGGQLRLFGSWAPYLPLQARKYPWGLRRVGSMMLYTNCGVGTIRVPVRLWSPPEVTLITLRSGSTGKENVVG